MSALNLIKTVEITIVLPPAYFGTVRRLYFFNGA